MSVCDPRDPNEWMTMPTWDETPVMPPSSKPLSFLMRGSFPRSQDASTPKSRIEPRSLPPAKYAPQKPPKEDPLKNFVVMVDGRRHINLDGVLVPILWERHPGPQSRYPPAIPVPNLSKKPKGRSVPTKDMGVRTGRTYTCKVEDCRKVFTRSEHLKRHVRSLHMHEKNYMCALPFCDKTFARRDNLLQHERKHKHYQAFFDCTKNFDGELIRQFHDPPSEDVGSSSMSGIDASASLQLTDTPRSSLMVSNEILVSSGGVPPLEFSPDISAGATTPFTDPSVEMFALEH
ncbi:hypothetical protein AcW1_001378 [Taiwanofungus camphoratus]|nr:hypothetical protein AcW2_000091 [Antrodia cinnamomea]KAI0937387.1 hypothetical protein AcV5_005305 [Antrodia cinnamomea]KAI0962598.1 hypothetical protein AcV7_001403 [Antrodia cinnamomea]KAI0964597.1 hypothetical protein AcW1_001378 [Antrodia cinnamomea]